MIVPKATYLDGCGSFKSSDAVVARSSNVEKASGKLLARTSGLLRQTPHVLDVSFFDLTILRIDENTVDRPVLTIRNERSLDRTQVVMLPETDHDLTRGVVLNIRFSFGSVDSVSDETTRQLMTCVKGTALGLVKYVS